MIAVNDSHLKAIARAIHFVRSGISFSMTPTHREHIEHDIVLLDQIHKFCRQQITEPGLPMSPRPAAQVNNGEKDGPTNTKAAD